MTSLFDIVLTPFEVLGAGWALALVSGIFGILALIAFKRLSFQRGIKSTKNKIKGHLIEIRLYQDDLVEVAKSFFKVLGRNCQYLALNFGPFIPLAIPFLFVLAQFVVRYAFAPVPVQEMRPDLLPGQGTTIEITLAAGHEGDVRGLQVTLPEGLEPLSELVRATSEGRAWQEVIATRAGEHEILFQLPDGSRESKLLVAGDVRPRVMQPTRVKGFFISLLWPAEESFAKESAFSEITFVYPDSDLGWMPGGVGGVLLIFLVSSMLFGVLVLKPLKIQI